MAAHRRVVACAPRSRTSGALAPVLGSALRCTTLASRSAEERSVWAYFSRAMRPRATAVAYRTFVLSNPNGYRLIFTDLADANPDASALAAVGKPVVNAMTRLAGAPAALEGARTFVAWAHGFVSMELAGAFRLGGDLDAAYAFGIDAILDGVSGSANPASG